MRLKLRLCHFAVCQQSNIFANNSSIVSSETVSLACEPSLVSFEVVRLGQNISCKRQLTCSIILLDQLYLCVSDNLLKVN